MTATVGTSTNINTDSITSSGISVDSTTAVTLIAAPPSLIPPRIKVVIYNSGNRILWVRLYAASVDNLKRGIPVEPGQTKIIMEGSDIYTGEVSGIMDSGVARDVYVTWY